MKGTTRKKVETVYPPKEIRDDTKARRSWLAAEADRINLEPSREAKIVGTGSYQSISVYKVLEVEARIQMRGTCQCCGSSVAVADGITSLHGYRRPGDGYTVGKCFGAKHAPANYDLSLYHLTHASLVRQADDLDDQALAVDAEFEAAKQRATCLYSGIDQSEERRLQWLEAYEDRQKKDRLRRDLRWKATQIRAFADYLAGVAVPAHGTPLEEVAIL
jgi:hypothetical protein